MEKDAQGNNGRSVTTKAMLLGGAAALLLAGALLWFSDGSEGGASDAVWWGVWGAGIALMVAGSLRNRRELEAAADMPAAPAAGATPTVPTPATGLGSVENLVQRSDDVAATLRDLVAHGQGSADYGMLPALLVRSGLMEWEGAPRFTASRLRRNRRWWLSCDVDELTDDGYAHLVALEGALNVASDLAEGSWPHGMDDQARVEAVFRRLAGLSPLPAPKGVSMPSGERGGEWEARLALSEYLENMPAPFRVVSAFQLNLDEGLACIDVAVPGPSCLALVAPDDPAAQAAEARAHAWRVALMAAQGAFAASGRIARVGVNCLSHGANEVLLSALIDRDRVGELAEASEAARPELPQDGSVRVSVREDGWLAPVEPLLRRADARLCPKARWSAVELSPAEATPALASACGAHRVSDLGINENALRASLWNAVVDELGTTTTEAVGRLMALKAGSEDPAVRDACDRTCQALVDGSADVSDRRALAQTFVLGDALSVAQARAAELAGDDATPADLERALSMLDAVLLPLAQAGTYADDEARVFRYFNSAAERVRFNGTVADGRRTVLVPDAYYGAHSLAVRVLTLLGRPEEAMVHADELARIAPVTPDAALTRVRCLEAQERIFECADLLVAALGYAATARDMGICLYRLAYMEWRLGRNELAVACYERAAALGGEVAAQAREELAELLETEPALHHMDADEVARTLAAAGVPAGDVDAVREEMASAAAAAVDAGLLGIARAYLAVSLEVDRDDALLGVYRSLAAPMPEG